MLGASRAAGLASLDQAVALGGNHAFFPGYAALIRIKLNSSDVANALRLAQRSVAGQATTPIDRILQQRAARLLPLLQAGDGAAAEQARDAIAAVRLAELTNRIPLLQGEELRACYRVALSRICTLPPAGRLTSNAPAFSTSVTSLAWPKVRGSKSGASVDSRWPTPPSDTQPSSSSSCAIARRSSGTAVLGLRATEAGRASGRSGSSTVGASGTRFSV